MVQQFLTGGDGTSGQTGLQSRNVINSNFTEVYTQGILENTSGFLYLNGDESTDGSLRFRTNGMLQDAIFEERESGVWNAASLELGSSTLYVGVNVGVAGFGDNLSFEIGGVDPTRFPMAHNIFDGETTIQRSRIINAYSYTENFPLQNDDSGEFTGTSLSFSRAAQVDAVTDTITFRTGATAATDPVTLSIYDGTDETGQLKFSREYPASDFPADTEITLPIVGRYQVTAGDNQYVELESDSNFSLKTDAAVMVPYLAINASQYTYNDVWEVDSYDFRADGVYSFTAGQDFTVQDGKPYVCNTTGTQTGTFASNIALWDLLDGSGGGITWATPVDATIVPDADGTRDLATALIRFGTGFLDDLDIANDIVVSGLVDGRDVATDGTKLDGIEAGAQVNVDTDLSVGLRTVNTVTIQSSTGDNATLLQATTSLAGVLSSADKGKLDGIESGAEVNVDTDLSLGVRTGSTVSIQSSTGNNATLLQATNLLAGVFSASDKTKLDGIEASADVTDETNVVAALNGAALPNVGVPVSADRMVLQDASDSNNIKYVQFDVILPRRDWGVVTVTEANAITGAVNGDIAYCSNGNSGSPAPIYYNSGWLNVFDNSPISSGGGGGTGVTGASVSNGGAYVGLDGNYPASQASTSGLGVGASFTVTLASGVITAVVSVDLPGIGYAVNDTITLSIIGLTETTAAVLTVDSIG